VHNKAFRVPVSQPAYLMIHQLETGRHDSEGCRITGCPEWHNPVMFIVWIEENISLMPGPR